ncbi:c-type cytochrome biogenesis protein CcmI [Sutterella sp.]|uniref:c-type cytochrome biogenesis protein CcmI n=1 Tax=Sutterella sp. TaxID=1981025 RepID=UPI0026DF1E84|nr:c-type cytochrome biogenesis protein CcmI [Sutterella sp.]MDO5530884.1 c-type cytochrome biogenesis protein CcmI [Sutterella sp.]
MSNPWVLYAICALMLIVAIVAVLPTILRAREAQAPEERDAAARKLVREALTAEKARLDADLADGRLTSEQYEAMLGDLRARVLEEQAPALNAEEKAMPKAAPIRLTRAQMAAAVTCLITFVSCGSYAFLGSPELLELAEAQKVLEGSASAESIEQYLKRAPKDGRAWVLLAHKKVEAGDFRAASFAYKAARDATAKIARDPDVMLEYGAAVLTAREESLYKDASKALQEALVLKPGDPRAEQLALMGAVAAEDWVTARNITRTLLAQMSPDSPDYMRAEQTLRMLEARAADMEKAP